MYAINTTQTKQTQVKQHMFEHYNETQEHTNITRHNTSSHQFAQICAHGQIHGHITNYSTKQQNTSNQPNRYNQHFQQGTHGLVNSHIVRTSQNTCAYNIQMSTVETQQVRHHHNTSKETRQYNTADIHSVCPKGHHRMLNTNTHINKISQHSTELKIIISTPNASACQHTNKENNHTTPAHNNITSHFFDLIAHWRVNATKHTWS